MYNLSLRRIEQVFNKFESCVLYELDSGKRFFDVRLLMQLIAEYDSVEFNVCYQSRKAAVGEKVTLPTKFKEKTGYNSDNIDQLLCHRSIRELAKVSSEPTYVNDLRCALTLSWRIANGFSDGSQPKTRYVSDTLTALQTKLDSYKQTDFARNSAAKEEFKAIERYKHPLLDLVRCDDTQIKVWTRSDYFKAVELAAHIEQDSMGTIF